MKIKNTAIFVLDEKGLKVSCQGRLTKRHYKIIEDDGDVETIEFLQDYSLHIEVGDEEFDQHFERGDIVDIICKSDRGGVIGFADLAFNVLISRYKDFADGFLEEIKSGVTPEHAEVMRLLKNVDNAVQQLEEAKEELAGALQRLTEGNVTKVVKGKQQDPIAEYTQKVMQKELERFYQI